MIDVFDEGIEQDITHVLRNRDARVMEQNSLIKRLKDNQSLVNAKLNIPGPIKNNRYLGEVFEAGLNCFLKDLAVESKVIWDVSSGPEAFVIVNDNSQSAKESAIAFEDRTKLGRLFDIDVLLYNNDLKPLSRKDFDQPERKCLICDKPAKVCARSRTHSVAEMQFYINKLINNSLEIL